MLKIKIIEVNPQEINWNDLVASLPEGTVFQTTYWARYLERYMKIRPIYIIAREENGGILGSLLLYRMYFFIRLLKLGALGRLAFEIINRLIPAATWRFGPLVYDKINFNEIFVCILKGAQRIAKKNGFLFLKDLTLPIHANKEYALIGHKLFSGLSFRFKEAETILIDLQADENELWLRLKNSARKAIKKADVLGLGIISLGEEDIKNYYHLLQEARKRAGVLMHPTYPNIEMWEELAEKSKILEMFGAIRNGQLLGAISILNFNGIFFEISPAQSNFALENNIYVNDVLKWHLIRSGHLLGRRLYDLNGIFVNPKNKKEKSLNQFKEKWGGTVINYYNYSKSCAKY